MKKIIFGCFVAIVMACQPTQNNETPLIKAAVVSARKEASKAGKDILAQGGNAFDAAVATSFALTVVYPQAGNITGGGFMVYRMADGRVGSLDYRETAPARANRDMYLDEEGNAQSQLSRVGGLAVGVPGAVAGIKAMHEKWGSLPWETLVQPAIDLAQNGYIVTTKEARNLNKNREIFTQVNGEGHFYDKAFKEGDTITNPALARTLTTIANEGDDGFYSGWVAKAMVEHTNAHGGILSEEDLQNYTAVWRDPVVFSYKDLNVFSMPPPSSGGICLGQMLKMIEPYNIGEMGHHSPESIHLMIEAERRSYADRSHFLGDPDFVAVPQDALLAKDYLTQRMNDFDPQKATPSDAVKHGEIVWQESDETTHFSIVDAQGNAVAITTTLNGSYGSKLFVPAIGVFMNNEMDDFSSKPGVPNMFGLTGSEANSIAPNKRMLSSMTPSIIEKDGELSMVVGTPGGSTIITSVFQTILNVYEHNMDMQAAVNAPRFHHQWKPDIVVFEPQEFDTILLNKLRQKGHTINEKQTRIIGKVDAIFRSPSGHLSTGADPRGDDTAAILHFKNSDQ